VTLSDSGAQVFGAFLIGLAVASAPGPVQALVVVHAASGGITRGVLAVAGAAAAMLLPLLVIALGVGLTAPEQWTSRALAVAGGAVTLGIAVDSFRSATRPLTEGLRAHERAGFEAIAVSGRVGLAVLLFPGTWLFLVGVATPLLASARAAGGNAASFGTAISLVLGTSVGNLAIAVLVGWGGQRASPSVVIAVRRILSVTLGLIGLALIVGGLAGLVGLL
jgi:threonine/homoserine/homoserine lactone efflux protein